MSIIIPDSAISDWKDLQFRVRDFFREMGYEAEVEKKIKTVREDPEVDVWIKDPSASLNTIYLVECKHWKNPVPPEVARTFRTIMNDAGANTGVIISLVGFTSGVDNVLQYTNIHHLTWEGLQRTYGNEWLRKKRAKIEALRSRDWEAHIHFDQEVGPIQNQVNVIFHTPGLIEEFRRLRIQGMMLDQAVRCMPMAYDQNGPIDMPCNLSDPECVGGATRFESVRGYFEKLIPALEQWLLDFHALKKRAEESYNTLSKENRAEMMRRAWEAFYSHRNFPQPHDAIL